MMDYPSIPTQTINVEDRNTMFMQQKPYWNEPFAVVRAFAVILLLAVNLTEINLSHGADRDAVKSITLNARSRVADGDGKEAVKQEVLEWDADKTAVIVCDMWDKHPCKGAMDRVAELAPRVDELVRQARKKGALIIHCPSWAAMKHYEGTVARRLAQQAPAVAGKVPLKEGCNLDKARESALPIDDSDGGCNCVPRCTGRKVDGKDWKIVWLEAERNGKKFIREIQILGKDWKEVWGPKQTDVVEIKAGDAVADGFEPYYLMKQKGIENVIVTGVHTNMCVLGRSYGLRQWVYQGMNVVLTRDLTDSMYNSRMEPKVDHFVGNDLVIQHIEKYWCPTISSVDLTQKEPFRFAADKRK